MTVACLLFTMGPATNAATLRVNTMPHSLRLTIKVESKGKLAYHLINIDRGHSVFGIMSCGQSDNWSVNKAAVELLLTAACDKNFCVIHDLTPGQSLDGSFGV